MIKTPISKRIVISSFLFLGGLILVVLVIQSLFQMKYEDNLSMMPQLALGAENPLQFHQPCAGSLRPFRAELCLDVDRTSEYVQISELSYRIIKVSSISAETAIEDKQIYPSVKTEVTTGLRASIMEFLNRSWNFFLAFSWNIDPPEEQEILRNNWLVPEVAGSYEIMVKGFEDIPGNTERIPVSAIFTVTIYDQFVTPDGGSQSIYFEGAWPEQYQGSNEDLEGKIEIPLKIPEHKSFQLAYSINGSGFLKAPSEDIISIPVSDQGGLEHKLFWDALSTLGEQKGDVIIAGRIFDREVANDSSLFFSPPIPVNLKLVTDIIDPIVGEVRSKQVSMGWNQSSIEDFSYYGICIGFNERPCIYGNTLETGLLFKVYDQLRVASLISGLSPGTSYTIGIFVEDTDGNRSEAQYFRITTPDE